MSSGWKKHETINTEELDENSWTKGFLLNPTMIGMVNLR